MTNIKSMYFCDFPNIVYGDDFSIQEIEKWFAEEENGYANLGYIDSETDYYPYHYMNQEFGWKKIPTYLGNVLSLGGAYAAEFERVSTNITKLTVVEPSEKFWREEAYGLRLHYLKPNVDGHLNFPDETFDTVTAFGVLHHIPNISFVLSELMRVIKPGGHILIREPIISMGDWSKPRHGLTKNERGIPLSLLVGLITGSSFSLISQSLLGFSPLQKICSFLKFDFWSSRVMLKLDLFLCSLFSRNYKYHRKTVWSRFAPSSVFLVVRKDSTA